MSWPQFFPPECPPADSQDLEVTVFRLVRSLPPTIEDFKPVLVEYPHRNFSPDKLCMACGVSVFSKLNEIIDKRDAFKALRNRKIAKGLISQGDGPLLLSSKDSHITWWSKIQAPHINFAEAANE